MYYKKITLSFSLLALAAFIITCYTNPLTHRKSMNFLSPAEENSLGLQAFNEQKSSVPISSDQSQIDLVNRVGHRIANVANLPNAQWEFVAFKKDDEANAYCLPGGKVGIYTGILPITQDEVGLATVMAHEVGHAVARHGGERMSEQMIIAGLGSGLQYALQNKPQQTQQLALAAYGVGATVGVELPHSRSQESEADYMGLLMMAKAGYDPNGAITFWQRFKAYNDSHGGNSTPEFLRDHPLDSKRIADLQKHLPEAMNLYHASGH